MDVIYLLTTPIQVNWRMNPLRVSKIFICVINNGWGLVISSGAWSGRHHCNLKLPEGNYRVSSGGLFYLSD